MSQLSPSGSGPVAGAASGASQPVLQQQPPVVQLASVAGLTLVPDSPHSFSGMPPLEDLPKGVTAPFPSCALDQDGFWLIILLILGRVVQKPVNVNPGLKVNRGNNFSTIKMLSTVIHVLCGLRLLMFKTEGQKIY